MNAIEIVLWGLQAFLALFFLAAGAPKVIARGLDRWTGFSDLPRPLVILIGVAEVLGAVGLVLPMSTGAWPWLTPLAAIGLAVIVLMAAGFHLRAAEHLAALETVLWAGLASVIAIGRWDLIPGSEVPGWALVVAGCVLLPAALVNIVVLWRASNTPAASDTSLPAPDRVRA